MDVQDEVTRGLVSWPGHRGQTYCGRSRCRGTLTERLRQAPLDVASQRPAAEEEVLDVQHAVFRCGGQKADQAVVAEPVPDPGAEGNAVALDEPANAGRGVTTQPEVELGCPGSELSDPIHVVGTSVDNVHLEREFTQVFVATAGTGSGGTPLGLQGEGSRAGEVFRGHLVVVGQLPRGVERVREARGIGWQLDHREIGMAQCHLGAFCRTVVDEHHALRRETELIGDRRHGIGLRPPGGVHRHEVVPLQRHVGMCCEDRTQIGRIVARAQHQDPARLCLAAQKLLDPPVRAAGFDVLRADLPAHPSPQCVVGIRDDRFGDRPVRCGQPAQQHLGPVRDGAAGRRRHPAQS